jgi:hypothetical protein
MTSPTPSPISDQAADLPIAKPNYVVVYATRDAVPRDAQDAARWRYAVKHWLEEHSATKLADEAIAASAPKEKAE